MSATTTVTDPPEITADNVATLFPDVDTSLARDVLPTANSNAAHEGVELEGYDEEQVRLMDEVCIVLDNNDRPIGSASKKTCKSQPHNKARSILSGGASGGHLRLPGTSTDRGILSRPLDDQHRQGSPAPRLFRFPV
jgi:hypothetical protein